jgi:hypothetical protein
VKWVIEFLQRRHILHTWGKWRDGRAREKYLNRWTGQNFRGEWFEIQKRYCEVCSKSQWRNIKSEG